MVRNIRAMSGHLVAVLALDGVVPIDLAIPVQVFSAKSTTFYRLTVCGDVDDGAGTVAAALGYTIGSVAGLEVLAEADTIIVPGYRDHRRPPSLRATTALRFAARAGVRMASICTGAFALAAAGVLDGRTVTTHWGMADDLEKLYPQVRVNRDVLYIDDGDVLTSAGVTAGTDL